MRIIQEWNDVVKYKCEIRIIQEWNDVVKCKNVMKLQNTGMKYECEIQKYDEVVKMWEWN